MDVHLCRINTVILLAFATMFSVFYLFFSLFFEYISCWLLASDFDISRLLYYCWSEAGRGHNLAVCWITKAFS